MKKTELIQSVVATAIAGISIYALKKREEKIFKKEYKALQKKHKEELEELRKILEEK